MITEKLVIPSGKWKFQIDRNDDFARVSIVDDKGVCRYICLSHDECERVREFLSREA